MSPRRVIKSLNDQPGLRRGPFASAASRQTVEAKADLSVGCSTRVLEGGLAIL
jgi:hypothetical protein